VRDHPSLIGRNVDEILDSWIFAGDRGLIDCVWRAGARVVSGGRHRDRDAIERRYSAALRTVLG
jgi:formimidoylglutamate deiminase